MVLLLHNCINGEKSMKSFDKEVCQCVKTPEQQERVLVELEKTKDAEIERDILKKKQ
jgi:hypothetical protein